MGQLREACTSFAPQHDPVRCKVCFQRLSDHTKSVREAFYRSVPEPLMQAINHRQGFLKLIEPAKCALYRPVDYGSDVVLCDCGRLRTEHNLKVIIKGADIQRKEEPFFSYGFYTKAKGQCGAYRPISEGVSGYCQKREGHVSRGDKHHAHKSPEMDAMWTDDAINGRKSDKPCDSFAPIVEYPGTCRCCNHRYIDHNNVARGRQLEDMSNMHSPGCHCVQKVGDHSCSCMGDMVKQQMLESLGTARRTKPLVCQQFTPAAGEEQISMHCVKCNKSFYHHQETATNGTKLWPLWRATRMTDGQVLLWFIKLGNNMAERMNELQQVIMHPDKMSPFAPTPSMCKELMQMLPLDLKKLVKPPPLKHKPGCLGLTSCDCATEDKMAYCDSCHQPLERTETTTCGDCIDYIVKNSWARPVLSPPKVSQAATEPNINAEGGWDDDGGLRD